VLRQLLSKASIASESLGPLGAANEISTAPVDQNQSAHLVADIEFVSLNDWAAIRAQLAAVKAISAIDVAGLTLHEAQIGLTYLGQTEQLQYAMAQQNLNLSVSGGQYTLELSEGRTTPASSR
jgi:hypothetical protein